MNANENAEKDDTPLKVERHKDSLKAIEEAIKINPRNAELRYKKGNILNIQGRHEDALKAYEKAIKINPRNAEFWYNKGDTLLKIERYKDALKAYEKAIEINPKDAETWYRKGYVLDILERYKDALEAFDKTIEIKPEDVYAWNGRGNILKSLERYKDALEAYEKAIKIDPNDDLIYAILGELLFDLGDLEKASRKVEETLNINKKNTLALVLKGRIEIEKKDYIDAIESFQKAIYSDLSNPKPILWNIYAEYLNLEFKLDAKDKKYEEGIAAIIRKLERINELYEKEEREVKLYTLYLLGYFYYKNGDIYAAKEKLEKCIRIGSKTERFKKFFRPKPPTKRRARELLNNIWKYKIKPSWWNWWWSSPVHCWPKRILFSIIVVLLFIIVSSLFSLSVSYPFMSIWPFSEINPVESSNEINWPIYVILILILVFVLLSPGIQSIRAEGFGVELYSSSSLEPVLSPLSIETRIKELEKHYKK